MTIELPYPDDQYRVADWAELTMAINGCSLSSADISATVESASNEETDEPFLVDVWSELERRSGLYENMPYEISDGVAKPTTSFGVRTDYLVCLLLSLFGNPDKSGSSLFERLTGHALSFYLSGDPIVFGWPPISGQPINIEEKTRFIANQLHERFIEAPDRRYKDRGLDVVSFGPFGDGRSGQVVILVQCAAGKHWALKQPVPQDAWEEYIHWGAKPVRGFAIPQIIRQRDWHDRHKDFGLMIDRVRLVNLLQAGVADPDLQKDLSSWVQQQLSEVGN